MKEEPDKKILTPKKKDSLRRQLATNRANQFCAAAIAIAAIATSFSSSFS